MHIISKTTMRVEPLCGWSGNPMEGVTVIHINKRNLKFEKDQIVIFHTWKIVQHQKRIPILQVNLENLIPKIIYNLNPTISHWPNENQYYY